MVLQILTLLQILNAVFLKIINEINGASDHGATFSRIKIYGALPALGSCHDIEIPFIYNKNSNKFYQKSNDYTFDAIENDEEIEEAA